ncbi:MAG: S8 family serine peptidase [Clostridia bacterium]|nr:S8 family serine peptidase [Clostridia bacterium]
MKKILAIALALCLLSGSFAFGAQQQTGLSGYEQKLLEQSRAATRAFLQNAAASAAKTSAKAPDKTEPVRVIIVMEETGSLLSEDEYSERVALKTAIEELAEGEGGLMAESVSFGYDYDTLLYGFSADVPYGLIPAIRALDGVKGVHISHMYSIPEDDLDMEEEGLDNAYSQAFVGVDNTLRNAGYTGKGQVIAVLDNAFDLEHAAFCGEVADAVFAEGDFDELELNADVEGTYFSDKIPFEYDYADGDNDARPVNDSKDHGTHVAGIAAANAGRITGCAPDAQLVLMKVFADATTGAYDSDIFAALEDAVEMGVDVVNMSLGSDCGFWEYPEAGELDAEAVYEAVRAAGITLCISAGNAGRSTSGNYYGATLIDSPDDATVGTPSTYSAGLSVASIAADRDKTMMSAGELIAYNPGSLDEGEMPDIQEALGENGLPYLYCGLGSVEEIEEALTDAGIDLEAEESAPGAGYIALIQRGELYFTEKVENATNYGFDAVVVFDNTEATTLINMALGTMNDIPAVFISLADGTYLAGRLEEDETPILEACDELLPKPNLPSEFSSWGPTPDLKLKPDVAAMGGGIYSSVPNADHNKYSYMSGTSMSSPQLAGVAAVLRQALAERGFEGTELDDLTRTLLMNTATPITDISVYEYEGEEYMDLIVYSPRVQGAGLANVVDAMNAQAYVTVDDNEDRLPKAELGQSEDGTFSFTFTVHSMADEELQYMVYPTPIIQDFTVQGYAYENTSIYDPDDFPVAFSGDVEYDEEYDMYIITVPAGGEATVTADLGVEFAEGGYLEYLLMLGEQFELFDAESFPGVYVEGFITIDPMDPETMGSTLGLPYMGFYGNWGAGDALDYEADYYLMAPRYLSSISAYGEYDLGSNIFEVDEEGSAVVNYDYPDISAYSDGGMFQMAATHTSLLRAAKSMTYEIYFEDGDDPETPIETYTYKNVGRTIYDEANDEYSYAEYMIDNFWFPDPWVAPEDTNDYDPNALADKPNGRYRIDITVENLAGELDGYSEWFYVDQDSPSPVGWQLYEDEETGDEMLLIEATDNREISALLLAPAGEVTDEERPYWPIYTDLGFKVEEDRDPMYDAVTRTEHEDGSVTYEALINWTEFSAAMEERGMDPEYIYVSAYDYAFNYHDTIIQLKEIMHPDGIALMPETAELEVGDTCEVMASFVPAETNFTELAWRSDDPSIATVTGGEDCTAIITAVAEGTTTIHALSVDTLGGEVKLYADGTMTVTVVPASEEPVEPGNDDDDDDDNGGGSGHVYYPTAEKNKTYDSFSDLPEDAWYKDGVTWALENGVMAGTSEDNFSPNAEATRAMVVTTLWAKEGKPTSRKDVTFEDVNEGDWFYEAVRWAAAKGIVAGYSEEEFGPNDLVTREQLATILYAYAKTKGEGFTGLWAFQLDYEDADEVAEWAYESVCWMTMNDIITGMGNGKLAPKANSNRAQIATILMNLSKIVK